MPSLVETIKKINSFAELPQGWHFGEGVPPSPEMRDKAKRVIQAAEYWGLERANAFPGAHGEIQVTFYRDNRMLELSLELDGSVTMAEDEGKTQVDFREDATISEAYSHLREFSQSVWTILELSTVNITIQNVATFPVEHWIYEVANPSPSSKMNVRVTQAERFANTWRITTESRSESHPFTGRYRTTLSQTDVASSGSEVPLAMIATATSTAGQGRRRGRRS